MIAARKRVALSVMARRARGGSCRLFRPGLRFGSGFGFRGCGSGCREGGCRAQGNAPEKTFRLIGDGSTSFTGSQPKQPVPMRLTSGQKPAQFVVFSWGGVGGDSQELFSRFREVGRSTTRT